ncbi:MAG: threonine--tRNA ligase [Armatimonadota bacterium]|nr:threonine--tRNA ligase [Armatimonadota bacterium]
MSRIRIHLPDGRIVEYPAGISLAEVAADLGLDALAAKMDGKQVDLSTRVERDCQVEFLDFSHPEGRSIYWHSSTHLMAQAVKELFPEAKLAIGPPIEDGFYYDFDIGRPFEPQDLERIEARMRELAQKDQVIERVEIPREEAYQLLASQGEKYKLELLAEIPDEKVSFYRQDGFIDMCRGPHIPRTGLIKAIKLLSTSGAYWRGDERREMLQRIYGITFPTQEELDLFLQRLEEAKKRDHRRLGRELDLFSIHEEVGPGLVLWHPKGALVRRIIEAFISEELERRGYQFVYTPHVARVRLWEISGHMSWYRENMYSGMEVDEQEYLVKPMNCPFHIMIYRSQTRSYRDLPMRLAEFGTVYRYERPGVLHGLLRVRGLTQDDAHIFCRPDQIEEEVSSLIDLAFFILGAFGFRDYHIDLSVRDPEEMERFAGSPQIWDMAERALEEVLRARGLAYQRAVGEANFYGPKIDIHLRDAIGRMWQMTTIQLDFNLPERFDLTYMGADGREHRPVMIHRAIVGSLERFLGILIEHYAGAFPTWLAPEQVRVLPITDRHLDYARQVLSRLQREGLRATVDETSERISYKVRQAQIERIPYMLVVGDREQQQGQVAVRSRSEGDLGPMDLGVFLARIKEEIEKRV